MRLRRLAIALFALAVATAGAGEAFARGKKKPKQGRTTPRQHKCLQRLEKLDVDVEVLDGVKGVRLPVKVRGPIAGVTYRPYRRGKALILDCSLVYSLALVGPWMVQAGIREVRYSSALQRRKVRGTNKWSNHSFGLALDLHELSGPGLRLTVKDDFEQGLGDDVDCVGGPLTTEGAVLQILFCQLERSELFRFVLTPNYDEGHYNHFHVEALPWGEREDVRRPFRPPAGALRQARPASETRASRGPRK